MICEKCKRNKATVKIAKIIDGEKIEQSLCVNCAFGLENNNVSKKKDFDMNKFMENLLNHIDGDIEEILDNTPKKTDKERRCEICGTTYEQIKKDEIIGCGNCYKIFKSEIEERIRSYQGMNQIRKTKKYNFISEEKKNLNDLESELLEAIEYEDYERAAIIRDTIKEFKVRGISDV